MKDIFAELDAGNPQANVNPVSSSSSDIFSSMDVDKKPEGSSLIRRGIGDPLVGLARGTAVGIPETAFGLLDIPTLGYAGKTAEAVGKGLGIGGFKEGREFFNKMLTPETQEAQRKVSEAEGFVDTVKTAVQNPSSIIQVVTESIPAMLTGTRLIGAGQKALGYGLKETGTLAGEELLAAQASNKAKQIVTGALGEAAVTAGANIESVRQETEDNLLTPMQVGINVASAAVTGIIGTLGGKLANRLGIEDINTLMAGGFAGANKKDLLKSVLYGAFQEGALEELPQSMQEQIAQNIALSKPIDDQIFEQGAIGLLAGIAQSTGAQVAGGMMQHLRANDSNQQDIDTQIAGLDPEIQKAIGGQDGNVTGAQIDVERQVATEVDRANTIIDEEKAAAAVQPGVIPAAAITPAITPVVAPAAPTAIPDAIRTEVAGMSDTNLARTAAEDREPIVRQAAAEEIQKRATSVQEALTVGEKQVATPASTIDRFLQNKSQAELAKLANENKGEPIGIAAGTLFEQRSREAAKQVTAPVVAPEAGKVDYEAQAANQGISLENFKKQDVGVLNSWAKTGVFGAQIELERRAQEGTIQPNQITWKTPEAATQPPTLPAAGEPTVPATKVPTAAPFAQEVKVKGEVPTRIAKVVDYHKKVLNREKTAEDKLKAEKAIGLQMAAVQRKIEGRPTKAEFARTQKKLSSMYTGRPVTIETQPAVITGKTSFGKYQVRLQDGTEQYLPLSKITTEAVTNDEVYRYLRSEGLRDLEQAEKVIAPAKKEGKVKYGTREEFERQAAGPEGEVAERDRNVSEVQEKHQREVVSARQGILAPNGGPPALQAEIRKGEDKGIVLYPEGYVSKEYQDILAVAQKYDLDVIPVLDTSGMTNAFIKGNSVFINMTPGDISFMETALHEISHHLGNAETQGKIDTDSNAFIKYRQKLIASFGAELSKEFVLEEYAADLEAGIKSHYGINLTDGLRPGTTVESLSKSGGKAKASGDISYSIARDKGARILEEGSPKKFKTIFQIANHLSRRAPINYQTATTAENREVERKLSDFLETCLNKVPEAKGWYKKDFARTMQILQALDPNIKKPENNFRMRLAIAIASNGNDSVKTMDIAWSIYRNWADSGSFTPTVEGNNSKAINRHTARINQLRSRFKSDLEMEKWLMGVDTVRNIKSDTKNLIKVSSGENEDVEVPRASVVVGPKLGAFFNNLSGNFDPVTMDRWFMRTIGRITGTAVKASDVDTKREQFRNTITDEVISSVWGNEIGIVRASEITGDDLDSLALAIDRGKWRDLKGKYDEARNAGNRLAETLKGQLNDSPSSGGHREWIRERMKKVRKAYPRFDLSDIQAAIWIGEKELYHELGGRREKADYYSEGAETLARRTGKGELLRRAAGPAGRVRPADTGGREQPALFSVREGKESRIEPLRSGKPGLSRQIFEMAKANPDGFTIDISTGGKVAAGYAVSPAKETELPLDELTEKAVYDYVINNGDLFDYDKRAFFGGWLAQDPKSKNFGKFVLDISFVVDNLETAVYLAEHGEQDGIYHIEADQYIPTGEGIQILKERGIFNEGRRAEHRRVRQEMRSIIEGRRIDQAKYSVRRNTGPVRPAGQLSDRGRAGKVQGQILIDYGVHYSSQPRKELDSKYYGTGLADATSRRLPSDPKSPLRHRIHFYYNPGTGMPPPEVGVGPYQHDVDLSGYKIFDLSSGAIKISQVEGEDWRNTLEKALLKAGFDGFANPDYGVAVLLGKRKVAVQPVEEARYSVREAVAAIPEWLNTTIGAGLSTFTTNPQGLPRAEVEKVADELKTHKDFSKIEYALSVPARMAQKHPNTWGKLYRIFAVDREETRDELRHEFQKMAEPFLMYDQQLRKKKLSKEEITASMGRVQRAIIVGDTVAAEFTDEQLTEGITDKYGQELKLNKDEIAAYRSVRNTLRHIRTVLVNHLANQSLRGYRRNKWFRILEAAMKGDALNVETIQVLLDKKGMKQAALDRAKKLQPDITKIFERIESGVDKIPPQEIAKAGKAYEKIANSMQAELTTLQGYVSELTGVTDKTELSAMTREIFSAYMQTRPQMKVIRALRNEVGSLDGYFPRFRETGDKKFRVYLQELDENGNIVIDEKTGKEARREVYMGMFSNARQGNDVIRDAMKKLKIKESDLTPDGKFPPQYYVEIARQTASPESAYQGVNDINLQRIFDDAMRAAQEKGVHGLDATYTDANGNEVNVFEQIRQAGLQSLTNHLKARGAMQRSIKRSEDLIEGYQEVGLQRVLLDYITSMSGLMTKQVAASEAMELLSTIKDPFLFASMSRYTREMLRNNSLADRISGYTRAAAFTYFLGGLLKSAVVNMTQNPIVGFAELGKFMREHKLGGAGKSDALYAKAMKDVLSGNLTVDEKAFIDKMVNRGIATNQFIQAVFDNVMNKGLRRHIAVMNFMAKPFSMSEVFNRKSAAIAMYRAAYSMRLSQAEASGLTGNAAKVEAERMTFDDARDFVTNVHYAYGKTNRPLPIMTGDALGAVASSLYTFKGFSHNFLARQAELLSKGDFRTLGHTLAYLALFGGLSTFPFLRDLFDWWEKEYGYNPMNQVRASLRGIGGETLEKFGVSGLPSVLGANFSGSLATGLPWPIGASSPEDSIFGVWAGVMTKAKRSAEALSHGDLNRGITEISPEFMRAPRVAIRESEIGKQLFGAPGYATNIRGHAILGEDGKPISLSAWEAALKALGFNPTEYARAKEKTQNVVRQVAWVNDLKQNVAERYRAARLNNDKDAVKDMMANVKEVNQKIRSRNLQQLVTPLKISNVMKSAMPKIGAKERREMLYKRQVL